MNQNTSMTRAYVEGGAVPAPVAQHFENGGGIANIPMRLREIGRIRVGDTVPSGKGTRPNRLSEFRFTSTSERLLEAVAAKYGGEVKKWDDAPSDAVQYELYSESQRIDIVIPPLQATEQYMELWKAGGCQRRCDGVTEMIGDQPCQCPSDVEERMAKAGKGQACKPTTRLRVLLPGIPGMGTWRLETHSYYAAAEIPGVVQLLAMASANKQNVPAVLSMEPRERKVPGKNGAKGVTKKFSVPIIDTDVPFADMLAAGMEAPNAEHASSTALEQTAGRPAEEEAQPVQQAEAASVDQGQVPAADAAVEEIDLSKAAGEPNPGLGVDSPLFDDLVEGLHAADYKSPEAVEFFTHMAVDSKGQQAMVDMLRKGWSPQQIVTVAINQDPDKE